MIPYTLIRSRRKTIALYVRNGQAEVHAPMNAPKHSIDQFVISKEKWIQDKLAASSERQAQREAFALGYGAQVAYRGRLFPIAARPGKQVSFDEQCFYMPPSLTAEQIKHACIQIYRLLAKRDLTNKVVDFSKRMGATPLAVKINGAKTRWGSCSGQRSLNFSWRLMMADDAAIDYVIVHELAHLMEMNHSDRFWAIVEGVLPDYKARQTQLKDVQNKLSMEDWE